jgi:hypothetical protein
MKDILRNYKVMALLSTCLFWIYCDNDADIVGSDDNVSNTNFIASRTFSFEVDIVNQSRLSVESINGSVVITGRTGVNSAVITGERKVGSESVEDAEAHLEELEVSVSDLGNEILVQTTQPSETHGRSYTVNYDIALPNDIEVMITSINGNVEIDSIGNQVTTSLTNGQVILDEISGNTDIDLTNGNINAEVTLPLDGIMDLDITNGNIDLDIPINTSATFSAGVVNGLITISDNLTLHNPASTPTSRSGTLGGGRGTITLNTTNGNINVTGF